jgi:chorismate--pyruvate lyase
MKSSKSPYLHSWLVYPDSLMNRLKATAGESALEVIAQGFNTDGFQSQWWEREVIISAQQHACWYARTLAPISTYEACAEFFDQLNTKSLGELIFKSNHVKRVSLIYYPISHVATQYQWLPQSLRLSALGVLWLRASCFQINAQFPFYLTEIFLPTMQRVLK